MGFRRAGTGEGAGTLVPADALDRFVELYRAFEASRSYQVDKAPLRFAAATLISTPGEPDELAARILAHEEALSSGFGFFSSVARSVRRVLAAILVRRGEAVEPFVAGFSEARRMFREQGLRRSEVYELIAYAILRIGLDGGELSSELVARVESIYLELRRYHFWLTGPEDLPACAALAGLEAEPQAIGRETEAMYVGLRERASWWPGERLHTASHILTLSGAPVELITERAATLAQAFGKAGYGIGGADYDDVALLCFLGLPVERIVEEVLRAAERLRAELRLWPRRHAAFTLATSIAFVQLLQGDPELEQLSDVRLLLEMQAIVSTQRAVAAVVIG